MLNFLKSPIVINAALFQIVWFACVLGGAQEILWPAVVSCAVLLIWQLHPARRHPTDLALVALSVILALIIDTLWIQAGFMRFTGQGDYPAISPPWIILLWIGFALTINHSLAWLSWHPALPAAVGLIGGPMSYYAGLRIGAVEYLDDPLLISACVGLAWAVALLLMVRVSRFNTAKHDTRNQ